MRRRASSRPRSLAPPVVWNHALQRDARAATSPHFATCVKAPARSCTEASLYLLPRSLGAACVCSPNVTLCELVTGKWAVLSRTEMLHASGTANREDVATGSSPQPAK